MYIYVYTYIYVFINENLMSKDSAMKEIENARNQVFMYVYIYISVYMSIACIYILVYKLKTNVKILP
jgi:hypothetical protein